MLASTFIIGGWDNLTHPERVAPLAEPMVRPLAERVPALPDKTEQVVRISGAVQVVAGCLLAVGRFPRLSALAIAATLVPTTAAGHRFWETDDKQERAQQRIHFLKNASMLGGLLIAAADTAGKPSLAWRTRNAARSARHDVTVAAKAGKAGAKAGKVSGKAGKVSGKAGAKAAKASAKAAKISGKAAAKAGKVSGQAGARAGKLSGRAAAGAARARDLLPAG